jgi:hypothetical protein
MLKLQAALAFGTRSTEQDADKPPAAAVGLWPIDDGQLSELLAPNQAVRADFERQQSGAD